MDNQQPESLKVAFRAFVIGYVTAYIGVSTMIILSILYIIILYAQTIDVDLLYYADLGIGHLLSSIGLKKVRITRSLMTYGLKCLTVIGVLITILEELLEAVLGLLREVL